MLIGSEITIVGGGIGGMAAALALARRGASVRVLEQAPDVAEVGAGLQISPNGMRVLRALDVDVSAGMRANGVRLLDGLTGRQVLHMALSGDGDWRLWHRADLLATLEASARAAGVDVVTGCRVTAARQVHGGVALQTDSGALTAGLAIGADGLHSVLRKLIDPSGAPAFFTGHVAWRAVIPAQVWDHPPQAHVWMGPTRHLVSYPLRGGSLINLVGVEERAAPADDGWRQSAPPEGFRAAFVSFGGPVPAMLSAVTETRLWGLWRHPVAGRWHLPMAALLGDAAHPTLPFMAQGANMALEDAWVLAARLAQDPPEQALSGYAALRRPRCARLVETANRNARAYHMGGLLRPALLAGMALGGKIAPRFAMSRFNWIFDEDVTTV